MCSLESNRPRIYRHLRAAADLRADADLRQSCPQKCRRKKKKEQKRSSSWQKLQLPGLAGSVG